MIKKIFFHVLIRLHERLINFLLKKYDYSCIIFDDSSSITKVRYYFCQPGSFDVNGPIRFADLYKKDGYIINEESFKEDSSYTSFEKDGKRYYYRERT